MFNFKNKKSIDVNEPICKFGPGGDFSFGWPGGSYKSAAIVMPLTVKFVGLLNEIIGPVANRANNIRIRRCDEGVSSLYQKDGQEDADRNHGRDMQTYVAASGTVKINPQFQGQPVLFPDDSGAGVRNGNKSKHSFRAHRRIARQRPAIGISWEGSLFETDITSVRTA